MGYMKTNGEISKVQTTPVIYSTLTDSQIDFEIRRLKPYSKSPIKTQRESAKDGIAALKAEKQHRQQCHEIEEATKDVEKILATIKISEASFNV
jgi:hypothetical protein